MSHHSLSIGRWAFVAAVLALLPSCSDETSGKPSCPVGSEGCACTSGSGCDPGLVCLSQRCVDTGSANADASTEVVAPPDAAGSDAADASGEDGEASTDVPEVPGDVTLSVGSPCTAPTVCGSGLCSGGVCCASACAGKCETCTSGQCTPVPAGADPDDECPGDAVCDGLGGCQLLGATACQSHGQCASSACVGGVCCDTPCGGGCLSCNAAHTGGANGACLPVLAASDPLDACPGGAACDGTGTCWAGAAGVACAEGYECTSGHCSDAVCCDAPCDGLCERCDGDSVGSCAPATSVPDPGTCAADVADGGCVAPPCACDAAGECKASSAVACSSGGDCAGGTCAGGICCEATCPGPCASCSGAHTGLSDGTCAPVKSGLDPLEECAGAAACDGSGACFAKALGEPCVSVVECAAGGLCVDGVCCGSTCDGTCQSCQGSQTGAASGTCAATLDGSDPINECAGPLACNGKSACYAKVDGAACVQGYECTSGHCVDGHCCNTSCTGTCLTCSGLDTTGLAGTCSFVINDADPDGDCAGATTCDGTGKCYDTPNGSDCNGDSECASGVCAGGTCCAGACAGPCYSCKGEYTGKASGVCAVVKSGFDPKDDCSGGLACNGYGKCWSKSGGDACVADFECTSGACCGFQCGYGWQAMSMPAGLGGIVGIWGNASSGKTWASTGSKILARSGSKWDLVDMDPLPAGGVFVDIHGADDLAVVASKSNGFWWNKYTPTTFKNYGAGVKNVTSVRHLGSGALPVLLAFEGWVKWFNGTGSSESAKLFTVAGTGEIAGTWSTSPQNIYAGGFNNSFDPKAYHYDGQAWTDLKPPANDVARITAVTGYQGKTLFAWTALLKYGIATWDGASWGKLPPMPNGLGGYTTDMVACGDRLYIPAGSKMAIYEGGAWTLETTPSSVLSIWCASECGAFAGGNNGTIYRR